MSEVRDNAAPECDVRPLTHDLRRRVVWTAVTGMRPGQSMVLVNDHDPLPIRAALDSVLPGALDWSYLERGPRVWRLLVSRRAS